MADTGSDLLSWVGARVVDGKAMVADPTPGRPLVGDPSRFGHRRCIPQTTFEKVDAQTIADALASHGVLIVRSFLPAEAVALLRSRLEDVQRAQHEMEGRPELIDTILREAAALDGLKVSPEAYRDLVETYEACGIRELVGNYLGEQPVMMTTRTELKRKERDPGLGWHQDAAVLGGQIGALNAWTALTPVGRDCPSLDFVARRIVDVCGVDEAVLEEGRNPRPLDYLWADAEAELDALLEGEHLCSPALEPGDSVIFDEMSMHRTGRREWVTPSREVLITWWFAPSRFPAMKSPIAF